MNLASQRLNRAATAELLSRYATITDPQAASVFFAESIAPLFSDGPTPGDTDTATVKPDAGAIKSLLEQFSGIENATERAAFYTEKIARLLD